MEAALTMLFAIGALAAAVAMVIARHPMRVALALIVKFSKRRIDARVSRAV